MGVRSKVKRPAVFLDRDGTLIEQFDEITDFSQMRILRGVPEGIRLLNKSRFLVIVVTNQPVIGKGLVTKKKVDEMHMALSAQLKEEGAFIDAFYVCPHRYGENCACRKPNLGLIEAAIQEHGIDVPSSFFVGDDMRDIETGRRAKMKTILVETGNAGRDTRYFNVQPDEVAHDLVAAAESIIRVRE